MSAAIDIIMKGNVNQYQNFEKLIGYIDNPNFDITTDDMVDRYVISSDSDLDLKYHIVRDYDSGDQWISLDDETAEELDGLIPEDLQDLENDECYGVNQLFDAMILNNYQTSAYERNSYVKAAIKLEDTQIPDYILRATEPIYYFEPDHNIELIGTSLDELWDISLDTVSTLRRQGVYTVAQLNEAVFWSLVNVSEDIYAVSDRFYSEYEFNDLEEAQQFVDTLVTDTDSDLKIGGLDGKTLILETTSDLDNLLEDLEDSGMIDHVFESQSVYEADMYLRYDENVIRTVIQSV